MIPSEGCEKQGKGKVVDIEMGLLRTLHQEP